MFCSDSEADKLATRRLRTQTKDELIEKLKNDGVTDDDVTDDDTETGRTEEGDEQSQG